MSIKPERRKRILQLIDTYLKERKLSCSEPEAGAEWFGTHGSVQHLNTMVFIDDAVSAADSNQMLQRIVDF